MAAKKPTQRAQKASPQAPDLTNRREFKVTQEDFVSYLNSVNIDAKCQFCNVGEYAVGTDPSEKSAAIVATPVPHVKGVGMWLYAAICQECGHVAFFHAPFVASKIAKD